MIWTHQAGFYDIVSSAWSTLVRWSNFFVMEDKLRIFKRSLKSWAKTIKTQTSKRKEALKELGHHQSALEEVDITHELLTREAKLQKTYHQACREEEEYWRQKSRSLWLQAGDKNTRYFHQQAEAHKHFKTVNEIHFQDQEIKDFEGIKQVA